MKQLIAGAFFIFAFSFGVQAQDFKMPQASPSVNLEQTFSTSFIKIEYSRPSVHDRKIFGDLIPYGQVWRTGANAATKITFGEEVFIGDGQLKPGAYALFTIPGEKEWRVMFNSGTKGWGAGSFDEKENVLSLRIPVEYQKDFQESFRISLEELTTSSAVLELSWADVRLQIPIRADNHKRIMAHLEKELRGDNPPYFRAAAYMLESGEDLKSALSYVDKAIKQTPDAYYMYWTKARIEDGLGLRDEALKSARTAADMAKKTSPNFAHEYERNYKNLMQKSRKSTDKTPALQKK